GLNSTPQTAVEPDFRSDLVYPQRAEGTIACISSIRRCISGRLTPSAFITSPSVYRGSRARISTGSWAVASANGSAGPCCRPRRLDWSDPRPRGVDDAALGRRYRHLRSFVALDDRVFQHHAGAHSAHDHDVPPRLRIGTARDGGGVRGLRAPAGRRRREPDLLVLPLSLALIVVPVALLFFSGGLLFPNLFTVAMSRSGSSAGIASAVLGTLFILGTSLVSAVVSRFSPHSVQPLAAMLLGLSVLAAVLYASCVRRAFIALERAAHAR